MNFCNADLGTVISAEKTPEAEGYEAKNLLSSSEIQLKPVSLFQKANKGFLGENFVRPPVKLVVTFPCCIEISHLIIGPKVGTQISNAFLIETETIFGNPPKDSINKSDKDTKSKHVVSKEFINGNLMPDKIIFRNPRFNLRKAFWKLPTLKEFYRNAGTKDMTVGLRHPSNYALERVVSLEITILRTGDSSIPCIGSLEIWGQPCVCCPANKVQSLMDVFLKPALETETSAASSSAALELQHSNHAVEDEPSKKRVKLFHERNSEKKLMGNVSIPEDFLDNLTYELMTLPIRLPSGLAIDSSTLEKYSAEEAINGRLPNDPFTGIAFTDNLKPLADAALKSRIDLFLTQNSNTREVKNLPRTLGSAVTSSSSTLNSYIPIPLGASASTENGNTCVFCKITWNPKLVFFASLCSHTKICRTCMATQNRNTKNNCSVCGISWAVNECRRIFL